MGLLGRRRLIIVAGKGGVGKTTVASALAWRAARFGLRVLLVGIDTTAQIAYYFSAGEIGGRETEIYPGLWSVNLDRQMVFDSFIRKVVRVPAVYRRILASPVYQYFTAAAPGIKDLMVLDLIHELEARRRRPYDHIIVDAPATGHGVSFLDVVNQILKTFRMGPIHWRAKRIQELLSDREKTGVVLVTLAEEMPVNETIELESVVRQRLGVEADLLVVNAVYPDLLPGHSAEELGALCSRTEEDLPGGDGAGDGLYPRLLRNALFQKQRRQMNERYVKQLRQSLPHPLVEVPFLHEASPPIALLARVARYLE